MSGFANELWDQWEDTMKFQEVQTSFLGDWREYFKERAKIEQQYNKSMMGLADKFKLKSSPINNEMTNTTFGKAWLRLVSETKEMGSQHDHFAQDLIAEHIDTLKVQLAEKKAENKSFRDRGAKLFADLKKVESDLGKAKKSYMQTSKDAETAQRQVVTYDGDPARIQKKADTYKAKAEQTEQKRVKAETDYTTALDNCNSFAESFYMTDLPQLFREIEQAFLVRMDLGKSTISTYSELQSKRVPFLTEALDNISAMAVAINPEQDVMTFVETHKTGLEPPLSQVFEQYGSAIAMPTGGKLGKKSKSKKKLHLQNNNDFSDLPPAKRKKAFEEKIASTTKELNIKTKELAGLSSLVDNYTNNPSFADEKTVRETQAQLVALEKEVALLDGEKEKYSLYLEALVGANDEFGDAPPPSRGTRATWEEPEGSGLPAGWEEAYDDDGNVYYYNDVGSQYEYPTDPAPGFEAAAGYGAGAGYDAGAGAEDVAAAPAASTAGATATYDWEGKEEGELPMTEGEEFTVIDNDGEGWVHVQNAAGTEGFVPLAYLTIY